MPRKPRLQCENAIFHIIVRGINHSAIFLEDADKKYYLFLLSKFAKENSIVIYAYVLMGNHVHLLIKDNKCKMSRFVKQVAVKYVAFFNEKYERSGNMFQDRFRSEIVQSDRYFMSVLRYIHQNPIKAGLESKIGAYKWSSYLEYINEGNIVQKDFTLELFDGNLGKFIKFSMESNTSFKSSIDIFVKKIKDEELIEYVYEKYNLRLSNLQPLSPKKLTEILRALKKRGATIRQLERLFQIPKSTLARHL